MSAAHLELYDRWAAQPGKAPGCPDTGPMLPPFFSHCTPQGILLLMPFRTCEKGLKYTRQIIWHDSLENVVYLKCSQRAECMPVVTVITHFLFWPSWEITDLERSNLNLRIFAISKIFFLFLLLGAVCAVLVVSSLIQNTSYFIWPCSPKVATLLEIHNYITSHFLPLKLCLRHSPRSQKWNW